VVVSQQEPQLVADVFVPDFGFALAPRRDVGNDRGAELIEQVKLGNSGGQLLLDRSAAWFIKELAGIALLCAKFLEQPADDGRVQRSGFLKNFNHRYFSQ